MYAKNSVFEISDHNPKISHGLYKVCGYENTNYMLRNKATGEIIKISHSVLLEYFIPIIERVNNTEVRFWLRWVRWMFQKKDIKSIKIGYRIALMPVVFPFGLLIHYGMAAMHGSFALYMFFFNRERFKLNRVRQRKHLIDSIEY